MSGQEQSDPKKGEWVVFCLPFMQIKISKIMSSEKKLHLTEIAACHVKLDFKEMVIPLFYEFTRGGPEGITSRHLMGPRRQAECPFTVRTSPLIEKCDHRDRPKLVKALSSTTSRLRAIKSHSDLLCRLLLPSNSWKTFTLR